MRINQFLAHYTKHSRREAEKLVLEGRVKINHEHAKLVSVVKENDKVFLDKRLIKPLKTKIQRAGLSQAKGRISE